MKIQEAIEILKHEHDYAQLLSYVNEALKMAISALEKQIPKKPILAEEQHIRYLMDYICPLCGKHFSGTGIASYCYHCGQALIWDDHPTEKGGEE